MKLTNPEIIQENEKDLIDNINAELDWETIERMLLDKHRFTLQKGMDYKKGDLIVYKDKVAYKFDFEIKLPLSVIFNRKGECLEMSTMSDDSDDAQPEADMAEHIDSDHEDKVGQMASDIADMISEINQGDKEE